MLPVPTVAYLAQFSGRAEDSYGPFAEQALVQATLMFSVLTQLEDYPADPNQVQLAINGILHMADRLYLEQPFQSVQATPFNSETIGSYTYSKGYSSVVAKVMTQGELTGIFWWDLAVEELTQRTRSLVTSGSISALEYEDIYTTPDGTTQRIISPGDLAYSAPAFFDNAELNPRPHLG